LGIDRPNEGEFGNGFLKLGGSPKSTVMDYFQISDAVQQ